MRSLLISIAILGLVGTVVGVAVGAQSTDDVTATVTAKLISVSVSSGTVAYGILDLNTTTTTVALGQTQTATNDSNVAVDLGIRSSDATSSSTNWNLAAAAGDNAFTHEFSTDGSSYAAFDVNNSTYSTLVSGVAASGSQTFDLRIGTPTTSSDSLEHTITVTVQATEA